MQIEKKKSSSEKGKLKPKNQLSEEDLQEINEAFSLFDPAQKGNIQVQDLKKVMRALGFSPEKQELKEMKAQLDKDTKGLIDFNNFLDFIGFQIVWSGIAKKL